jgi:tubulin--tyrosine ligase
LSHTLNLYTTKNPTSILKSSVPKTFIFNLSFPDELDELLMDDLHELSQAFECTDEGKQKWWILKAALADRGNGIRLFNTRQMLEDIFEEFDILESDEDEDDEEDDDHVEERKHGQGKDTAVDSSQLREWTIQEYISKPLLLDPIMTSSIARKFHLRGWYLPAFLAISTC